jgi:TRAP-type C4-dicarboxylate transport system substrate-binding protein
VIAKGFWEKLSADEQKTLTEVTQEAAARATNKIKADETKLVQFFKDKGLTVSEINKAEFLENVNKNTTFESFGYRKADWEKIQAVK